MLGLTIGFARADDICELAGLDAIYPSLEALYRDLHQNPELSLQEEKTAAKLTARLWSMGYEVAEYVGGHGVVAVLKNGAGPTVLVPTDIDALPVKEETGLPYASQVVTKNPAGETVPVMNACGHDTSRQSKELARHVSVHRATRRRIAERCARNGRRRSVRSLAGDTRIGKRHGKRKYLISQGRLPTAAAKLRSSVRSCRSMRS